ncbi:MAG TPA: hypothetical protein VGV63_09515 [Acidimicrobiales bacterium]|nr:hypothetical protein [Acidimicrobiales bacterium]
MHLRRLATATVLGLLVLGGCKSEATPDDDATASSEPAPTTERTTTTEATSTEEGPPPSELTTTTGVPSAPFGTTGPSSAPPPPGATEVALLADVEVAGGAGADRVVFRFVDAQLPGYGIAYVDGPARQDGSGEIVPVEGQARLQVRFEPASGVDLRGGTFEETYRGPDRLRGPTQRVTEVVRTGDFEGNLTWVVGVDAATPYRVEVLPGDNAIVVELGH